MAEEPGRRPTLRLDAKAFRSRHRKGDLAEIAFLAKVISLGFTVCRPFSGNARFDFVVEAGGRLSKVQVKSCWERLRQRKYQIRVGCGVNGRPRQYRPGEIDFIAAYVVREDMWYVIPVRAVRTPHCIGVFPHEAHSRGRFEKYREAWRLLR